MKAKVGIQIELELGTFHQYIPSSASTFQIYFHFKLNIKQLLGILFHHYNIILNIDHTLSI